MASATHQRGQAIVELLIAVSFLIAFFYLSFEVSEIALKEQSRYRFQKSQSVPKERR